MPSIEISYVPKATAQDFEQYYQQKGNAEDNKKENVVRVVTHSMIKKETNDNFIFVFGIF